MYLAVDPADKDRVLIPVVGLPFADYDRVRDRISIGSTLVLRPVSDNPHDPNAVEVHFSDEPGNIRIGFMPRDAAPGLRLALGVGAIEREVLVGRDGAQLAITMPMDLIVGFIQLAPQATVTAQEPIAARQHPHEAWPFRVHMPGESEDPDAPQDSFHLMLKMMDRLREKAPGSEVLKDAELGILEYPEHAAGEHLFDVADAIEERLLGLRDPDFDAACTRDKIGGLPFCEAGWEWPCCPSCGQEMVFLGQSRDPANPDDLVQAFWCVDTVERGCDGDTDIWEEDSTVRLWRDPIATTSVTIRPQDQTRIIPGHRLRQARVDEIGDLTMMRRDGVTSTHFNDCSYDEGRHRVFDICLGPDLFDERRPEAYTVVRHGRGVIASWEDWGG